MRLLHAKTISLQEFPEDAIPNYAILSHTWEKHEVSFQDMQAGHCTRMDGYAKIKYACRQALSEKLDYVWVDTCCIDKRSSSELSEAINSMFQWYRNARSCYAYLVDVPAKDSVRSKDSVFRKSRWFTRGWTLQELIAPLNVEFYSKDWTFLGSKSGLAAVITEITGIDEAGLSGGNLRQASVAKRMSWASKRVTTRKEDIAYCLLGIFGVNMPMLYGEGDRAFMRLQEEIIKESDDQSLFAWGFNNDQMNGDAGIFAQSPAHFAGAGDIVPCTTWNTAFPPSMTSKGLRIELPIYYRPTDSERSSPYGLLSCHLENDFLNLLALPIDRSLLSDNEFTRAGWRIPLLVPETDTKVLQLSTIYIHKLPPRPEDNRRNSFLLRRLPPFKRGLSYELSEVYPPDVWNPSRRIISTQSSDGEHTGTLALMHFTSETAPDFLVVLEYMHELRPLKFWQRAPELIARCHLSFKPKMSLEELHRDARIYVSGGNPEPVMSLKIPLRDIKVSLRKEEVMGIEMFVVDVDLKVRPRS